MVLSAVLIMKKIVLTYSVLPVIGRNVIAALPVYVAPDFSVQVADIDVHIAADRTIIDVYLIAYQTVVRYNRMVLPADRVF